MLENRTDKDNKITASSKTTWKDEESLEAGLSKWSTLVHRLCKAVSLFVGAEKSETEAKFYWGKYHICSIFLNKAWAKLLDYSGTYSILFRPTLILSVWPESLDLSEIELDTPLD